jgi:putative membrane protein
VLSLASGFAIPVVLGWLTGVVPAIGLYFLAQSAKAPVAAPKSATINTEIAITAVKLGVK